MCLKKENAYKVSLTTILSLTVDKLQFEPPLRKETEAHSEMVIITL